MNEENLNITLFCLDYTKDNASLSVTQEQIAQAKAWLLAMIEERKALITNNDAYINKKAPWPDYSGNAIYEGDVIEHPSGERGTVIIIDADAEKAKNYQWKVKYDDGAIIWLGSQIGDKGMASVVRRLDSDKGLDW